MILAAVLAWFASRGAVRPVAVLTGAAEHVAATRDLEIPIEVTRRDEIGRLAASFNTMLAAWPLRAPSSAAWWPTPATNCAPR